MYQLLIKTFVRDYKNTEDAHVREQYGTVCSIISIVCNIVLVVFKLIFGTLVHSVSIVADGYNNLSDAGSNIATFFGFKLANKHPDAEHPYGHGRFEYITGLGISFLIILVIGYFGWDNKTKGSAIIIVIVINHLLGLRFFIFLINCNF